MKLYFKTMVEYRNSKIYKECFADCGLDYLVPIIFFSSNNFYKHQCYILQEHLRNVQTL